MKDPGVGRRDFLKSAVAGGAAAASAVAPALPQTVAALIGPYRVLSL